MIKHTLLIESLRFDASQKKLYRLNQHIERLRASAKILFRIQLHEDKLRQALDQALHQALDNQPNQKAKEVQPRLYKIRITMDCNGAFNITSSPLPSHHSPVRICLSNSTIRSENIFQRHKTTQRSLYDAERKRALQQDFHEVIFFNQKEELAEGSIHNVFILERGIYYTPPLACGVLPGIMRASLLQSNPSLYQERVITKTSLLQAEHILLTNSVVEILQAYIPAA